MSGPGRRRRLSDAEVRARARDLVRRGAWKGLRIRETGLQPMRGRPRPGEVPLLTALAAETHYSERALRRILAGHDRDGRTAHAGDDPLRSLFILVEDFQPPEYPGYPGPGGRPVLAFSCAPAETRPAPPPASVGARGLDALGLRTATMSPPVSAAPTPAADIRSGLLEHLDAALAMPGVLPSALHRLAETLSQRLAASVVDTGPEKNPAANQTERS
jgi:hypothetical protein